jgi:hypothetical protein
MLCLQIPVTFSRTSEKQSEKRAYKNKEYSYKYITTGIYSTAISASSWCNLKSKTCFSLAMQQDRMGGRSQQSAPYSYYRSRLFFYSLPTKVMCCHQYANSKFYTRSKSPVVQQGKRKKKPPANLGSTFARPTLTVTDPQCTKKGEEDLRYKSVGRGGGGPSLS